MYKRSELVKLLILSVLYYNYMFLKSLYYHVYRVIYQESCPFISSIMKLFHDFLKFLNILKDCYLNKLLKEIFTS